MLPHQLMVQCIFSVGVLCRRGWNANSCMACLRFCVPTIPKRMMCLLSASIDHLTTNLIPVVSGAVWRPTTDHHSQLWTTIQGSYKTGFIQQDLFCTFHFFLTWISTTNGSTLEPSLSETWLWGSTVNLRKYCKYSAEVPPCLFPYWCLHAHTLVTISTVSVWYVMCCFPRASPGSPLAVNVIEHDLDTLWSNRFSSSFGSSHWRIALMLNSKECDNNACTSNLL